MSIERVFMITPGIFALKREMAGLQNGGMSLLDALKCLKKKYHLDARTYTLLRSWYKQEKDTLKIEAMSGSEEIKT